jgi:hypothetical protein
VSAAGLDDGTRLTDALGALPPVEVSQGVIEIRMPARSAALFVQP